MGAAGFDDAFIFLHQTAEGRREEADGGQQLIFDFGYGTGDR